jgi:hypothetical protein
MTSENQPLQLYAGAVALCVAYVLQTTPSPKKGKECYMTPAGLGRSLGVMLHNTSWTREVTGAAIDEDEWGHHACIPPHEIIAHEAEAGVGVVNGIHDPSA